MLDRIVVGYTKDQAGRDAVTLAGALAALHRGSITVVFPYHPLFAQLDSKEACASVAAEVQALIDGPDPTVRWSSSSWPIRALHELSDYEGASLLVFGAAKQDLGDRLHVSLMERMVHGAPCAVAVAPQGYAGTSPELRRIGVGFSISEEGHAAARLARELADASGARLQLIAGAGLEPALASYAFSSPALAEVEEDLYEDTTQTLERFCQELSQEGLEHETVRGDPASVLVERSSRLDLLVLGSRAYGPLRHALLGSVSAHVMRQAHCPVLVVPRGVARSDEPDREQPASAAHQG